MNNILFSITRKEAVLSELDRNLLSDHFENGIMMENAGKKDTKSYLCLWSLHRNFKKQIYNLSFQLIFSK